MGAPPGRAKDAEFLHHTDTLISEAASLLKAAFEARAPAEAAALFEAGPAFLSELLGLFEFNNIDVEIPSPIGPALAARGRGLLAAHATDPAAAAELAILERILREKEWVMRCVWGEETTGIYGDDEPADTALADPTAGGITVDADMGGDVGDDERVDEEIAGAAMTEARIDVDRMSFEQLLEAPWPTLHGTALFGTVARINHSCSPNARFAFPSNNATLSTIATAQVAPGEELSISYIREEADVQVR